MKSMHALLKYMAQLRGSFDQTRKTILETSLYEMKKRKEEEKQHVIFNFFFI